MRRQDCFIRSQTYHPKLPKKNQNGKIGVLKSENISTSLILNTGNDTMGVGVIEEESKDNDDSRETAKVNKKATTGEKGEKEKKGRVVEKPFCPSKLHCRNIPTDSYVEKWFYVLIDICDPDAGNVKEWFKGWCVVCVSASLFVCGSNSLSSCHIVELSVCSYPSSSEWLVICQHAPSLIYTPFYPSSPPSYFLLIYLLFLTVISTHLHLFTRRQGYQTKEQKENRELRMRVRCRVPAN